jgi:hypothetical protein
MMQDPVSSRIAPTFSVEAVAAGAAVLADETPGAAVVADDPPGALVLDVDFDDELQALASATTATIAVARIVNR